jgi:hypothetical protein
VTNSALVTRVGGLPTLFCGLQMDLPVTADAVASLASGLPLEATLPIRLIRPRSQAASGTEQRVSQ